MPAIAKPATHSAVRSRYQRPVMNTTDPAAGPATALIAVSTPSSAPDRIGRVRT